MHTDTSSQPFDAIVVGGSYAGISAAMQLARARRRVIVVDAAQRRNRFAKASHGFLGQDGQAPETIAAVARKQLCAYPSVTWVDAYAQTARAEADGFVVTAEDRHFHARRLVLAMGVVDQLPEIDGLAERWGRSVFHCPYCHGYELNEGRIGVLGVSPMSIHQAMMLPDWGRVTFFTNASVPMTDDEHAALLARGVTLEPRRVQRIVDDATVVLEDGTRVAMEGLFTASRTHISSPLAAQLGCEFEEGLLGSFIRTDATQQTTVPGVFACGDAARAAGNVAAAVGDGAMAGVGAHRSMMF